MSRADLHLHTCYSDGLYTPVELVSAACRLGLAVIAVTDHDTLDGLEPVCRAAEGTAVRVLPGVEITAEVGGREIHLLGYFFGDGWRAGPLWAAMEQARQRRVERARRFVEQLNRLGIELTMAEVEACAGPGTIGRLHVAQALVRRGAVKSVDEAFQRFLRRGQPAYVERERMPVGEAIRLVRGAGGVAVLAHPGLNGVDGAIAVMREMGLAGLEVWHTKHTRAQAEHYRALAEQLGLVATGGSDCHGAVGGGPLIGSVTVPAQVVEELEARVTCSAC
ncbi:MAG: PHP domain-containing protein [Verrucomicrobiae bacterium]|nr:PHP domain-containing protein [Verrucomicrobiae bacterium]